MFTHVDHIGLAVHDLEEAIAYYEKAFGIHEWERIEMPDRHMAMAVANINGFLVELITPTSDEAAFAKYLRDKGPGIHHIAYGVEDIDASLQQLRDNGVRMIDEQPRPGMHNTRVAFIHPKNANQGVLMELVQHQDGGHH
jgi:methylmalonyl-CoA/ethylmalonyl-CoA epimerase